MSSDHMGVNFKKFVDTNAKNKTLINFRNCKSIDTIEFSNNLLTNYEQKWVANCTHLINMSSVYVNYTKRKSIGMLRLAT